MKIAVLDDYLGYSQRFAEWGDLAQGVTVFDAPIPAEDLADTLRPFEVICVMRERTPIPVELMEALPNLRLIVTTGPRNLSIDMVAAAARGITVCGTGNRKAATAHLAMTLVLMAARNVVPNIDAVRQGGWQAPAGRDLEGLTLGLIGLGRLGAAMVELARPFGVNFLAWSQNLTDARCAEVGVERAETLPDLLSRVDIASIHLVLSDRTRGLIGAEELGRMKPDACLVNTSRGPIVDREALIAALHGGTLACAALDVFDEEPLPDESPWRDTALLDSGRLIITPHIGYGTLDTYEKFYRETAEDVLAFAKGEPIRVIAG